MRRAKLLIFLRRLPRTKDVDKIINNPELFEELSEAITRERPLMDFMKWLFEHRQEILDLIKIITAAGTPGR